MTTAILLAIGVGLVFSVYNYFFFKIFTVEKVKKYPWGLGPFLYGCQLSLTPVLVFKIMNNYVQFKFGMAAGTLNYNICFFLMLGISAGAMYWFALPGLMRNFKKIISRENGSNKN